MRNEITRAIDFLFVVLEGDKVSPHSVACSRSRCRAVILDGLLLSPLYFIHRYINDSEYSQGIVFLYTLFSWQTDWLYSTILHANFGQTVGKKLIGIRVVRYSDGSSIGWKSAIIRDLPVIIFVFFSSSIWIVWNVAYWMDWDDELISQQFVWILKYVNYVNICWLVLELLTMLFHPERRAVHDLIAGTIVVNKATSKTVENTP